MQAKQKAKQELVVFRCFFVAIVIVIGIYSLSRNLALKEDHHRTPRKGGEPPSPPSVKMWTSPLLFWPTLRSFLKCLTNQVNVIVVVETNPYI